MTLHWIFSFIYFLYLLQSCKVTSNLATSYPPLEKCNEANLRINNYITTSFTFFKPTLRYLSFFPRPSKAQETGSPKRSLVRSVFHVETLCVKCPECGERAGGFPLLSPLKTDNNQHPRTDFGFSKLSSQWEGCGRQFWRCWRKCRICRDGPEGRCLRLAGPGLQEAPSIGPTRASKRACPLPTPRGAAGFLEPSNTCESLLLFHGAVIMLPVLRILNQPLLD